MCYSLLCGVCIVGETKIYCSTRGHTLETIETKKTVLLNWPTRRINQVKNNRRPKINFDCLIIFPYRHSFIQSWIVVVVASVLLSFLVSFISWFWLQWTLQLLPFRFLNDVIHEFWKLHDSNSFYRRPFTLLVCTGISFA